MAKEKVGSLEHREYFASCIEECKGDAERLQVLFGEAVGINNTDKKSILEQAFRDVLRNCLQRSEVERYTELMGLSISSAQLGICYHTVPFLLLSDILDCVTLDICEKVFEFVEGQVPVWTQPSFYSSGKILLLRMCNDLLRRLSSTQNTVFCGRIQMFLARLFPLSEKSALNLMSHFNLENVTTYRTDPNCSEEKEAMEVGGDGEGKGEGGGGGGEREGASTSQQLPIDFNLYHKLWSLQEFFHQPTLCFSSEQWKTFAANTEEVLRAFSSYKLEEVAMRSNAKDRKGQASSELSTANASNADLTESHYFAKFLTSETLINLQLQDSHFRRHIMIQMLVLFQYLTADVKFKMATQTLSDSQELWVKEMTNKLYQLLQETPPNGVRFAAYVKEVLQAEEVWITWKNDGCQSFERQPLADGGEDGNRSKKYSRKRHIGNSCNHGSKKLDMGSKELSRLWNLCPDNLQACRSKTRMFVPVPEQFLDEAIQQADPEARIEAEYKVINNPNFSWQSLRLLSRSSAHFFQNTTAQIRPLPEYLDHVITQTGKDFAQLTTNSNGSSSAQ